MLGDRIGAMANQKVPIGATTTQEVSIGVTANQTVFLCRTFSPRARVFRGEACGQGE